MIEISGTKKSLCKHFDIIHGVSKDEILTILVFTQDEYKKRYEKPINTLYQKIQKKFWSS